MIKKIKSYFVKNTLFGRVKFKSEELECVIIEYSLSDKIDFLGVKKSEIGNKKWNLLKEGIYIELAILNNSNKSIQIIKP